MNSDTLDVLLKFVLGIGAIVAPMVQIWMQKRVSSQLVEVHKLVNSGYSVQLKLTAEALRKVADNSKSPIDEDLAKTAEELYVENKHKQDEVLTDTTPKS